MSPNTSRVPRPRLFSGLSPSTFLLALASLFADTSSEMLSPILPVFLTQTLGATPGIVGIVEGVAQAGQNVIQGFSGWLSDRLRRRKPIALFGYALGAIAKPLIGLSTAWTTVLGARSLERLASGTRSAPRDALIAASVAEADRGKAFGLEGIGDNLGAFLGPLLAIALLRVGHVGLRSVFFLAAVPGALAASMLACVREQPAATTTQPEVIVRGLPGIYWRYLFATALFGIGNSTNAFLILRITGLGASLEVIIFTYALFNLVAALASYPAGHLSDRFGRKGMILLSFLVFFAVYAGFGLSTNASVLGAAFVLYGLHQGVYRAVGKALATDLAPADLRASAVGWYSATIGLTGLVASIAGGQLWTRIGPAATFFLGAGSALVGSIALVIVAPRRITA